MVVDKEPSSCLVTDLLTINLRTLKSVAMSLYDIIHCSEQAKARTAYKLKNYRVRLGRYSNQICFQCASQATTCQQMGQSPSALQDCSTVCPHGHKGKTDQEVRHPKIPRNPTWSQSDWSSMPTHTDLYFYWFDAICSFIGPSLLYTLSVILLVTRQRL